MKSFFKIVFASMLGFVLTFFFLFIVLAAIIGASSGEKEVSLENNSILHLTLNESINDRSNDNPFSNFNFGSMSGGKQIGLNDILNNIGKAAADEHILGIFLDISSIPSGIASIEEIRNALIEFKKSGKFIYAYSEAFTQPSYYLASVADKIYLHPTGMAELKGLRSEVLFF